MIQTKRTFIRHIRLWGVALLGMLMVTACGSDTVDGNPYYLTGDMITIVTETGNMYYLKNSDGTVSLTYNRSNPMHLSADNKATLTDYQGVITIPSSITAGDQTYRVTGITANAFQNNTLLTKVIIPDGITSIGEMAFYNCPMLTEVNIPEGVMALPDYCFSGCKALTTLTLPSHMTSISKTALRNCSKLTELHIPEGITELSDSCLYGCSGLTQLTLPQSLTTIKRLAFGSCSKLTDIAIPTGVTALPDSAFYNCSSLLTAYLPETMTTLGPSAFAGCKSMIEITLPAGLTTIGEKCFWSIDSKTGASNWKNFTLYVKWETPPTLSGSITNAYQRRRVVVPKGCRDAYLAADYWNEFTQIMEKNYQ